MLLRFELLAAKSTAVGTPNQGTGRDDAVISVHLRKEYRKEKKDKKKKTGDKKKDKKQKKKKELTDDQKRAKVRLWTPILGSFG